MHELSGCGGKVKVKGSVHDIPRLRESPPGDIYPWCGDDAAIGRRQRGCSEVRIENGGKARTGNGGKARES